MASPASLLDTRILTVDLSLNDAASSPGGAAPPNTYGSINEAIRAAADGDTIVLRAGSYEERVLLDRGVHIAVDPEAEPGDTVVTSGLICTVPSSLSSAASVTNLVIQQMVDVRAGSVLLQNCEVSMGSDGVRICTGASPTIRQCKIHNCQGAGVYAQEGAAGSIVGCDISNVRGDGIHCNGTLATLEIRDNTIHHCANGVYFRKGARGTVEGNTISNITQFGVYVQSASEPAIARNQIDSCGIHGVLVSKAGGGSIKDNAVSGSVRIYKGCTPVLGTNVVTGTMEAEAIAA